MPTLDSMRPYEKNLTQKQTGAKWTKKNEPVKPLSAQSITPSKTSGHSVYPKICVGKGFCQDVDVLLFREYSTVVTLRAYIHYRMEWKRTLMFFAIAKLRGFWVNAVARWIPGTMDGITE